MTIFQALPLCTPRHTGHTACMCNFDCTNFQCIFTAFPGRHMRPIGKLITLESYTVYLVWVYTSHVFYLSISSSRSKGNRRVSNEMPELWSICTYNFTTLYVRYPEIGREGACNLYHSVRLATPFNMGGQRYSHNPDAYPVKRDPGPEFGMDLACL